MTAQQKFIVLGTRIGNGNSESAISLRELIQSRLLIFAGSNGGKSWLIRRILEQSFKDIQHIVMDVEGDFYTLREKFKYLLASNDEDLNPDMPLDATTGAAMARTIMELRASIIFDLSSLDIKERVQFVEDFSRELLELPKKLRHPVFYVVDEVQDFCDESERISSTATLNDLAAKARKRGICTIYATQRIAEVHKTAISQCHNKIIGLASLDIDKKRAATALGFNSKQADSIEDLETGVFYTRGPAINRKVIKVRIGGVQTTHPEAGQDITPPKPVSDEAMKKALAALQTAVKAKPKAKWVQLPGEAEEFNHDAAHEIQELRTQVSSLQEDLANIMEEQGRRLADRDRMLLEANTKLEDFEKFREVLRKLVGTPAATEVTLQGGATLETEQATVTVTTKQSKANFDESTTFGQLCVIAANGFFNEQPKSPKDVYSELLKHYNIDKTYFRYAKNVLYRALDAICQRPYSYLEKVEGKAVLYKITDAGRKYLRVQEVEA